MEPWEETDKEKEKKQRKKNREIIAKRLLCIIMFPILQQRERGH